MIYSKVMDGGRPVGLNLEYLKKLIKDLDYHISKM